MVASSDDRIDSTVKVHVMKAGKASSFLSGIVVNVDKSESPARVYVVTNAHGFRGFDRSGRSSDAVVVYPNRSPPIYIDRVDYCGNPDGPTENDLAVISGPSIDPPPVAELDEASPPKDTPVQLVGYPTGGPLSTRSARAKGEAYGGGLVELDQHAAQGMSGGPVYRANKVCGVIVADLVRDRGCLAVPIHRVRTVLRKLFPRLAAFADRTRPETPLPRVTYQPNVIGQIAAGQYPPSCIDQNGDGICDQTGVPMGGQAQSPPATYAPPSPSYGETPFEQPIIEPRQTFGRSFRDGPDAEAITIDGEAIRIEPGDPTQAPDVDPIRNIGTRSIVVEREDGDGSRDWVGVAYWAITAVAAVAGIGIPAWATVAFRAAGVARKIRNGRRGSAGDEGF
ncbi:serine protease [uncultured Maricaulis sp.]|uniref:S1 family peptidase n=1 Tax=uncultured Maricaulis sp. TaxID=174710 RepID=UPI0030DA7920